MKKKHDSLLHGVCVANSEAKSRRLLAGFAVLLITAIFTVAGCATVRGGGSDSGGSPELAAWAGTWKALDQYFDTPAFTQVWADGAAFVNGLDEASADFTAETLKAAFKTHFKADFKSFRIEGNRMSIYTNSDNASGSPSQVIDYVYERMVDAGEYQMPVFKGQNTEGQFTYLSLTPAHSDGPDAMIHFHLWYGESADSLFQNLPTVTPASTTVAAIAEDVAGILSEDGKEELLGILGIAD